ncbi:MAG TPA: DUF1552 domain-containing protein [Verrucomicrobia bacterium]|nr:DUF1552 domain-containing protein [Verrucomicrobiota bacterium]HOP97091.1 DUF1552 domain-containing protein [Verrucomicrobiota bacterium]
MKTSAQPHRNGPFQIEVNRRRFLRGIGACLALPAFESLRPLSVLAAPAPVAPVRMAVFYVPNGTIPSSWWPSGNGGRDFALPKTLEPLESVRHQLQLISGLDNLSANPGPDGAGDHARAGGTFLTGVRIRKTAGSDIYAGVSIDQVLAQRIGHLTRFPSLELTCDAVRKSGNCDSGYSCAYEYNLSWRSPTQPLTPESNPRLVFERLFGSGSRDERRANLERRRQEQRSILDFVLEDARSLRRNLEGRDRDKLDHYLTSVRDIEQRIERAERMPVPNPDMAAPPGIPPSYEEHIALMFDMLLLAFQTDSTRIATMLLAGEGSNRPFPHIGISSGHHDLTHHKNNPEMIRQVEQIDRWYVQQFARFLEKMENTRDVDGRSLLDNSLIVYGSGNADGNRHTHTNLPILLAGRGGSALRPGRYVKVKSTPLTNLFLSIADRMGAPDIEQHGDSTGKLEGVLT